MSNPLQEKPGASGAFSKEHEAEELGRCIVRRLNRLNQTGNQQSLTTGAHGNQTGIQEGLITAFPEATPVYIR
jgi:hypothetical protein